MWLWLQPREISPAPPSPCNSTCSHRLCTNNKSQKPNFSSFISSGPFLTLAFGARLFAALLPFSRCRRGASGGFSARGMAYGLRRRSVTCLWSVLLHVVSADRDAQFQPSKRDSQIFLRRDPPHRTGGGDGPTESIRDASWLLEHGEHETALIALDFRTMNLQLRVLGSQLRYCFKTSGLWFENAAQ